MKRPDVLDMLVERGLAVRDAGDGSWDWTEAGIQKVTPLCRMLVQNVMCGYPLWGFELRMLREAGFKFNDVPCRD